MATEQDRGFLFAGMHRKLGGFERDREDPGHAPIPGLRFDQRGHGFPRKVGRATDIGAYE
jgi:hypothetical protein